MLWEHRKRAPDKHWGGGREEEAWKGLPKEMIAEVSLVKAASLEGEGGNADASVCIVIIKIQRLRHQDAFRG